MTTAPARDRAKMNTAADAKRWLAELATWKRVEARFIRELTKGLPDDATIGEHWTDDEAQALFKRICDEERVPIDRAIEWQSLSPETERLQLREAADLLGWSAEARRRLGLYDA